jgi:hypothetical protein
VVLVGFGDLAVFDAVSVRGDRCPVFQENQAVEVLLFETQGATQVCDDDSS